MRDFTAPVRVVISRVAKLGFQALLHDAHGDLNFCWVIHDTCVEVSNEAKEKRVRVMLRSKRGIAAIGLRDSSEL